MSVIGQWRVGRSTGRTIWYGEHTLHGMVDTSAIATRICVAMNEIETAKELLARAHALLEGTTNKLEHEIATFLWATPEPSVAPKEER